MLNIRRLLNQTEKSNKEADSEPVSTAAEIQHPLDNIATAFEDFEWETSQPTVPTLATPIDFEAEFTPDSTTPDSAFNHLSEETNELEEWSEPLNLTAPTALAAGTKIQVEGGTLEIEQYLRTRGAENIYLATYSNPVDGTSTSVQLREVVAEADSRLREESMWRRQIDSEGNLPMLARYIHDFSAEDRYYLALERSTDAPTLEAYLAEKEADFAPEFTADFMAEMLLHLTQVAAFLVKIHAANLVHLGLTPENIGLSRPLQILDCTFLTAQNEDLQQPLSFAGYSAPELTRMGKADARSDIYSVGALLYRIVTGDKVPESGVDFSTWNPSIKMAGVPQILRRCLGEPDTRFQSSEELHVALLRLKNRMRPLISYEVAASSTLGLELTRSTNQDAYGFSMGQWESESGPTSWAAFCVSDGMGGMAAGEVASQIAIETFLAGANEWSSAWSLELNRSTAFSPEAQAKLVKEWAIKSNEAVVTALENRRVRGGCTLDAAFIIGRRLCIAHVGDSRLYLFRNGEFQLLSRDHSYVMSLVLQNEISMEEIRSHPSRNQITRSIGERHPQPDHFVDTLDVTLKASSLELQDGDVLLACSDGLWEIVLEDEMRTCLGADNLHKAAHQMLSIALERGAPDNATVLLLRVNEHSPALFSFQGASL